MAEYLATTRTNYFRVTDEKRYQELFAHLVADGDIEDFTEERDGVLYHGFGVYGSINYEETEDFDYDFDIFLHELQKILPDDEAFIYIESGHEKLRYVDGCAVVVTSREIKNKCLISWTEDTVKELLGEDNTVTECSYFK